MNQVSGIFLNIADNPLGQLRNGVSECQGVDSEANTWATWRSQSEAIIPRPYDADAELVQLAP